MQSQSNPTIDPKSLDADGLNWDALVAEGKAAARSQWTLGDLAREVETSYGGGELERYAEEIGVSFDALQDYRYVAAAYELSARTDNLTFSHFRRIASRPDRLDWLDLAAKGKWTVRKMLAEIEEAEAEAAAEAERKKMLATIAEENEDLLESVAAEEMTLAEAVAEAMRRQRVAEDETRALRERKQLHSTELAKAIRFSSNLDTPLSRQTLRELYDKDLCGVPFPVDAKGIARAAQNLAALAEEWE